MAACPESSSPPPDAGTRTAPPPTIAVRADRTDLLFTYPAPKGDGFRTATTIDEVPEDQRRQVVVTDLSLTPAERQAGRYVYVTDLTRPRDDGTYPVAVASRFGFETALTGTSTASGGGERAVVVYTTSWCGVCKTTKRLLRQWKVPFEDRDIEASRAAQQELAAKAARAGIQPGGVPVIDVAGILLQGLDRRSLQEALQKKGFL